MSRQQQDLALEREWIEEQHRRQKKMGFTARQQGANFKPLNPKVYPGVCTALVDVGFQPGGRFKDAFKVVIGFELPTAPPRDDGKPQMIYMNVTNSMDKKSNLRKRIESWFGKQFSSDEAAKAFDLSKLLGKPALVNVTNDERNGKVYANIGSLTPLVEGMDPPVAKGDQLFYVEALPETHGALESMPGWIKDLIDNQIRPEAETTTAAGSSAIEDDDIPF